jgi:hypothetical protein
MTKILPTELRIGNLLDVDGKFWAVGDIVTNPFELFFIENNDYNHSLNAKPIPLTEEWLLKFGFKYNEDSQENEVYKNGIILLLLRRNPIRFTLLTTVFSIKLQYVHQLQNLYFALTGEELIK